MTPQKIVLKGENYNYGGQKITLKTGKKMPSHSTQKQVCSTKQIQNRTALSKRANAQVSGCPTWDTAVHKLRTPNEAFFHRQLILGLSRQFGQINFGAFWVFSTNLSTTLVHVFHQSTFISTKKLSLKTEVPNIF